jgi:hypothetical protein
MTSAVCTLFEGDYHHGVGALINSLYRHGYKGSVEIGYRGDLPEWLQKTETIMKGTSITLHLHLLKTDWHLTNYKPQFLLELFAANPALDRIFYFDPDIVIKCSWDFFESWVEPGVALVEEIATHGMAYNHPLRRKWVEIAAGLGISVKPSFSQYFSGGFIGVRRAMIPYLRDWTRIMEHLPALGIDMRRFMPVDRLHPFCGTDQDAMNIFAMAAEPYLSTIGPEGMDFIPGGFTMSHAVGGIKPWRKNYLLSALKGIKPTMADKAFWDNAATPIQVFSTIVIRQRRAMMKVAILIGRFYHR